MTNNHAWRHIGSQSPVKHMHKVSQNGYQLCACLCLSLSPTLALVHVPAKPLAAWGEFPEGGHYGTCLYNSDSDHEPGWRAAGVAVVVPLAIYLSWQGLVRNMPDQPLWKAQPRFLQQRLAAQPPVALKDGLAETIRPFVAHLDKKKRKKCWGQSKAWFNHTGRSVPVWQHQVGAVGIKSQHDHRVTYMWGEEKQHQGLLVWCK